MLAKWIDLRVNGLMGVPGMFDLGKPALAHHKLSTLLSAPLVSRSVRMSLATSSRQKDQGLI